MTLAVIVLAGGIGSRFKPTEGYLPKPLISVQGKSQLFWATKGAVISYEPDFVIFACRSELVEPIEKEVQSFPFLSNSEVVDVGYSTEGPANTLEIALRNTKFELAESRIIAVDNDCFNLVSHEISSHDFPFVTTTTSQNPAHCFLDISKNSLVQNFHEKELFGDVVVSGNYGFLQPSQFRESLLAVRSSGKVQQELYLSTVMQELIEANSVRALPVSRYFSMGTPSEIAKLTEDLSVYVH